MIPYTLHKPEDYQKIELPGLTAWLTALRSGDFAQGQNRLCYHGKYCCLGVLSHLQGRLTEQGYDKVAGCDAILSMSNPLFLTFGGNGKFGDGIFIHIGESKTNYTGLTELNDNGLAFTQIANILEELYTEPT